MIRSICGMSETTVSRLVLIVLSTPIVVLGQAFDLLREGDPTFECSVSKCQVAVGEPIAATFRLRNDLQAPIRTRYARERSLARAECQLYARRDGITVSESHQTSEALAVWSGRMESGDVLEFTKLVVFLVYPAGTGKSPRLLRALAPGRYTVHGQLAWRPGHPLEFSPIEIEIVAPTRLADQCAADRVDAAFKGWIEGGPPDDVAECVGSVHVEAANEVEFLQECLDERIGGSRAERVTRMQGVVDGINQRVANVQNHPFELELLNARVKLLWKLEDFTMSEQAVEKLESAIDPLLARYPGSTYAREALKLRATLRGENTRH